MVNITHKQDSLRQAIAEARVTLSDADAIRAVMEKRVPKGDVFEFARAAGLLAIKKTADVIPDCHPLPVEFAAIRYSTNGLQINIEVEVHTIYKTGVEVEAMHGAAITALTMYDMLKPLDKGIEISQIRLVSKKGGKSDYKPAQELKAAIIVCSDTISRGEGEDRAGVSVKEKLEQLGVTVMLKEVIADEAEAIRSKAEQISGLRYDLLLYVGGTGLSPKDITPDTISPLITREIPGIMETARVYGQQRMPYAMLSRGVAGLIGNTLVITLPGSTRGATETFDALFPQVLHVFHALEGKRHP